MRHLPAGFVPSIADHCQAHVRIDSQGKGLAAFLPSVIEPPAPGAVHCDQQIHVALTGELVRHAPRLRLRTALSLRGMVTVSA